ncbi:2-polyprenyl-3-methyl-5-hydroxy-6-metoxy-1,4-benzoquinol methylase [Rhodonellum ikkaensis]|uniref:2-polyprenyl-3-methyl-5-hydroxy-6-metoxy-1,4-benzoquinol methylase n=1 Tax=Rhodonellum ikkaensis TaxID=336829 RepID=A0A1H3JUA6_9BACT|nr:class I SAM-dependent methyltransferase [Rhodonellum ikkaensis]SDY43560.1 2-polyprenyl-3-methyl-5-hydroxy-6-metoxy-1,4-benzoquinol methylase [Rhodonellum ikkaensis]
MRERLTKCPLCKSGLFLNHTEVKDFAVSQEKFLLCHCSSCKLIFTNPRPEEKDIGKYYDFEGYISHQDKSNNLTNIIYKWVRKITLKTKISWIQEKCPQPGRLLDYGCGTGYFLKTAKRSGWEVTGIEPNQDARKIGKDFGLNILKTIDNLDEEKKFDAITLFHVLEHIHSLRKTSKKLIKKLKNDGFLYIAVPNYDSFDSLQYKNNWASLDVPRHLYHFTKESIQHFANEMSMEIVDQKPMVFDSYYVSLLSESYVHPKTAKLKNLMKALTMGWKSNRWAKNNDGKYSSILFILKKK